MHIILSTRNPSKAEQIKAVLNNPLWNVLTLDEAGIIGEAIEDGNSLEENALKKARYAREQSNGSRWVLSDDTGLFITALKGEPGIKAARWAGENVPTHVTTQYCLERMQDQSDRSAYMETVVAVISPEGKEYFFSGKAEGTILEKEKCAPHPKMPYSALFKPDGSDKVWAQMTIDEENALSHRGKALGK